MKKTIYTITDMHCANCAMHLESLEDILPGVRAIEASYHTGRMSIEYDETCLSEAEILAAIQKKGYTALQA
jgi:copper chaperone CopZ